VGTFPVEDTLRSDDDTVFEIASIAVSCDPLLIMEIDEEAKTTMGAVLVPDITVALAKVSEQFKVTV
jgi:hypothetical protein